MCYMRPAHSKEMLIALIVLPSTLFKDVIAKNKRAIAIASLECKSMRVGISSACFATLLLRERIARFSQS